MMRLKQVHFRGNKMQMKLLLFYVQPIKICSSKSGMQWRSKPPFVTKGKHVTLPLLIHVCNMMQKSFLQFRKHCNYLSVRKWWKKCTLNQIRKRKPFSVVQVANRRLEGITSKKLYAFIGGYGPSGTLFWFLEVFCDCFSCL
jgi:hypothetical protein